MATHAPRAAALGIGSILSVRLATADQVVGGLAVLGASVVATTFALAVAVGAGADGGST